MSKNIILVIQIIDCDMWHISFTASFSVLQTRVDAWSNTSTVTLRVVGGDEKGSLESETVKIWSRDSRDSDPIMTALARTSSNCKQQTRPLVRESAPHVQTRNCMTAIKIWSQAPDGCFIPRQTGRLTVGRNIRLRLSSCIHGKSVVGEDCGDLTCDLRISCVL
jgi:hypothetical protein